MPQRRAYLPTAILAGNSYDYTNEGRWRTVVSEENEFGFNFGESVCPAKAGVFSGSQSHRGKSQKPCSLDGRKEGNRLI